MKIFLLLVLALSSSAAWGEMYTWKDAKGTVYYTNSLHEIPARYLKRARVLDVATGKKGGPATANPGTPAVSGGQAPVPQPQATVVQAQQPAPPAAAAPSPIPALPAPAVANPATPAPTAAETGAPRPLRRTAIERAAQRRRSSHSEDD